MKTPAPLPTDHNERLARARLAIDGLSIGDAFGQRFFFPFISEQAIATHQPPPPPWHYTDDTEMALGIFEVLSKYGSIEQDALADVFGRRYMLDSARGYGPGAHGILTEIAHGGDWRTVSKQAFEGQGSLGNGGAMRVAPVGAYFADDQDQLVRQADASAEVTHAHAEGRAGAIAVAAAVAWAWNLDSETDSATQDALNLLQTAADLTPNSDVKSGILRAMEVPLDSWEYDAANLLGNGSQITAMDTVPFCLWCAAAKIDNYPEALWMAVRVGGDIDTNAAIVGGIVAMAVGEEGIPDAWRRNRESLWYSSS